MKKLILIKILCLTYLIQSFSYAQTSNATYNSTTNNTNPDDLILNQKNKCESNSAKYWDSNANRCKNKEGSDDYRKDSQNCNQLTDLEQRKNCQLALASNRSNVTSDSGKATGDLDSSTNRSTVINSAFSVISIINMLGSGGKDSNCISAKILAATSIAGTLTDILMKIKIKKKGEELAEKYKLENSTNPFQAQYKALQYLKEQEESVKGIAELEKKRQMLLTLGYGTAMGYGLFEGFSNQPCASTNSNIVEKVNTNSVQKIEIPNKDGLFDLGRNPGTK